MSNVKEELRRKLIDQINEARDPAKLDMLALDATYLKHYAQDFKSPEQYAKELEGLARKTDKLYEAAQEFKKDKASSSKSKK